MNSPPEAKLRQWIDHERGKRLDAANTSHLIPNSSNWLRPGGGGASTLQPLGSPTPPPSANPFAVSLNHPYRS